MRGSLPDWLAGRNGRAWQRLVSAHRGQVSQVIEDRCVACHVDGTTQRSFLPRSWDHPVAGDGTTWRVVPGVLITSVYGCLQVNRLGGSGDGVPGGGGD